MLIFPFYVPRAGQEVKFLTKKSLASVQFKSEEKMRMVGACDP